MTRKAGLPPVARADARVLILGSLPGDASLAAGRYYAHPRNQFWHLIGGVIGRDLPGMDYMARLATLQDAGIALWDVVGEADRRGSLDQQIRDVRANDLRAFAATLPLLRAVAFNGQKAAMLGIRALGEMDIEKLVLPASSPANTLALSRKRLGWAPLERYLSDNSHKFC